MRDRALNLTLKTPYQPLLWVLLVAFVLRLGWWLFQAPVVSLDGAEYLCAARNLIRGDGYTGCYAGPELMYSPLYPVLVAALSLVVRNVEAAAHIVSVVFGTGLVLVVFLLASQVYGGRVAYIAATLTAVHPVLVKLAGSTYNETVYLPLLVAGIFLGVRAVESAGRKYCILTGALFGFAYLARPEAFAYPIFFALAVLTVAVFRKKNLIAAGLAAALLLGTFVIVGLPYVSFLYRYTRQVRLEGKWNINFTIENRILAGMDYTQAALWRRANPRSFWAAARSRQIRRLYALSTGAARQASIHASSGQG